MRAALFQLTSGDRPSDNIATLRAMIAEAVANGAEAVFTPEVTNCVSMDRRHQKEVLTDEPQDPTIAAMRKEAASHKIWIALGSVAVTSDDPDHRFANRSVLISPQGEVVARYDKIHMFDVTVSESETYRESAGYRPGSAAVTAKTPLATFGLSVCYDLRFPQLYRALAQAGAEILLAPSAFSPVTGAAHWHVLLRARAIETGCFVIAAAQTGTHPATSGRARQTYGHSLVVAPWGEILLDAGTEPGVFMVDLNLDEVAAARGRVPSLTHDRPFEGP